MPTGQDPIQRIRELTELRDSGAITNDEFVALKAGVIGDSSPAQTAQQPAPHNPASDPGRNNVRNVIGVCLILGGFALGVLLYFVVPVGGVAFVGDWPYTNRSAPTNWEHGQCTEPPHSEIEAGGPRVDSDHRLEYTCYDRAFQRRNIAIGVAFVGVTSGILVLVTRRRR